MSILYILISAFLLVPYFAWGIYTLRVKFRYHEELGPKTEIVTVVAVTLFMIVELAILRSWMNNMQILYIFTALGLVAASTALYGPMLVSLASQLFVDIVLPHEDQLVDRPQFAAIDALERVGDYEGAVNECMVIARIFPKDATVAVRVAGNLARLSRYDEAVSWFEQGMVFVNDADRALRITNRLVEIYQRELHRDEDALRSLETFAALYPDAERSDSVQGRISRIQRTIEEASTQAESLSLPEGDPSE